MIVDNVDDKNIDAYVLDLCGPEHIDEEQLVNIVNPWWEERKDQFPISFEFSRLGMTEHVSKIFRSFHIEYVTRVIGPLPHFNMNEVTKVRRRKRKPISKNIKVKTVEPNRAEF